jgi:hypothetical protein
VQWHPSPDGRSLLHEALAPVLNVNNVRSSRLHQFEPSSEDREELMRAGDQREPWWLVAFAEALVEGTDDRVVACPYYCGHV